MDSDEAFERMKLAIVRQKVAGWYDFSRLDMLSIIGLLAAIDWRG